MEEGFNLLEIWDSSSAVAPNRRYGSGSSGLFGLSSFYVSSRLKFPYERIKQNHLILNDIS